MQILSGLQMILMTLILFAAHVSGAPVITETSSNEAKMAGRDCSFLPPVDWQGSVLC